MEPLDSATSRGLGLQAEVRNACDQKFVIIQALLCRVHPAIARWVPSGDGVAATGVPGYDHNTRDVPSKRMKIRSLPRGVTLVEKKPPPVPLQSRFCRVVTFCPTTSFCSAPSNEYIRMRFVERPSSPTSA